MSGQVSLFNIDHRRLGEVIPAELRGRIAAAMFNLGYLPGGDKTRTTKARTTIAALEHALPWLRPGGVLSVLAYPAHDGGRQELDAVRSWLGGCPQLQVEPPVASAHPASPVLFLAYSRIVG